MVFVKAASLQDLPAGSMIGLKLENKMILLVNYDGTCYGIGNRCTHMNCLLSDGTLRNDLVQCSCHGSVFDVKTGMALRGLATEPEPAFEVKVDEDDILVNI